MALANRVLAGGNLVRAFSVTDSTSPSINLTAALNITGDVIQTQVNRQDSGRFDVTVEHVHDDATLYTYLNTYISVTTSSAIEELLFEDGTKEEAATSSNQTQLVITRGGLAGAASGNARKVGAFPSRLKSSSGGWTQVGETYTRPTLEYEGFKLSGQLVVPATYFNSIATTPAALTLTTSLPYGTVTFM